jgi:hypothetical protein
MVVGRIQRNKDAWNVCFVGGCAFRGTKLGYRLPYFELALLIGISELGFLFAGR